MRPGAEAACWRLFWSDCWFTCVLMGHVLVPISSSSSSCQQKQKEYREQLHWEFNYQNAEHMKMESRRDSTIVASRNMWRLALASDESWRQYWFLRHSCKQKAGLHIHTWQLPSITTVDTARPWRLRIELLAQGHDRRGNQGEPGRRFITQIWGSNQWPSSH